MYIYICKILKEGNPSSLTQNKNIQFFLSECHKVHFQNCLVSQCLQKGGFLVVKKAMAKLPGGWVFPNSSSSWSGWFLIAHELSMWLVLFYTPQNELLPEKGPFWKGKTVFSNPMIFEAQNSLIVFGEVFVFHQIPSGSGFHQPFPGRVSFRGVYPP